MTDRTTPGHLFVVHGRIESVVHDAAVVPTSDTMHLRSYWDPLLDGRRGKDLTPSGWPGAGWGRARDGSNLWFVSVGETSGIDAEAVVDRTVAAARDAAQSELGTQANRVLPVVAVPVTGIEGGGHGARRGELISSLMQGLHTLAVEHHVDIALVTPDAAVHAAAQHLRRMMLDEILTPELRATASSLGEQVRRGELSLFLGAGVSIPAGLPSWEELLQSLRGDYPGSIDQLPALDQAELLERHVPDFRNRVIAQVRAIDVRRWRMPCWHRSAVERW